VLPRLARPERVVTGQVENWLGFQASLAARRVGELAALLIMHRQERGLTGQRRSVKVLQEEDIS
jgi:hypothetical protein